MTCLDNGRKFSIISCYFPFDNGSQLNLSEFQSCLQVSYELLIFFENLNHAVFIIGDINADLLRNKRFDLIFKNFIKNNNLFVVSMSSDPLLCSYINGNYTATLDHCLTSVSVQSLYVLSSDFIDDVTNLSDHKPLLIMISWNENKLHQNKAQEVLECNKIIK
jgi:endonuclease/exonuclease/phosphatase family metal-dependent hydrolase